MRATIESGGHKLSMNVATHVDGTRVISFMASVFDTEKNGGDIRELYQDASEGDRLTEEEKKRFDIKYEPPVTV